VAGGRTQRVSIVASDADPGCAPPPYVRSQVWCDVSKRTLKPVMQGAPLGWPSNRK